MRCSGTRSCAGSRQEPPPTAGPPTTTCCASPGAYACTMLVRRQQQTCCQPPATPPGLAAWAQQHVRQRVASSRSTHAAQLSSTPSVATAQSSLWRTAWDWMQLGWNLAPNVHGRRSGCQLTLRACCSAEVAAAVTAATMATPAAATARVAQVQGSRVLAATAVSTSQVLLLVWVLAMKQLQHQGTPHK